MATAILDETRMAKKRMEPKVDERKALHPAYLRRGTHSVQDLRKAAEMLRVVAASLDGFAADMESLGAKEILVDGTTKLQRAEELLKGFQRSVGTSIVALKYE